MNSPMSETDEEREIIRINEWLEMAETNLLAETVELKADIRNLKQALVTADQSIKLALQVDPDNSSVNKMMANIDKEIARIQLSMSSDILVEEVHYE